MVNGGIKYGIMINGAVTKHKRALKPCPLCGEDSLLVEYDGGYFVKCTACDCMVARQISIITETIIPFEDEDAAIKVWNKRNGIGKDSLDPAAILERRIERADALAQAIKNADGGILTITDLISETGISRSIIKNMMHFVKERYPEIKSVRGKAGYYWEDIEDINE